MDGQSVKQGAARFMLSAHEFDAENPARSEPGSEIAESVAEMAASETNGEQDMRSISVRHTINEDGHGLLHRLGWGEQEVDDFQSVWEDMKARHNYDMTALGIALLIWILENIPGAKLVFQVFNITDPRYKLRSTRVIDDGFMKHAISLGFELDKLIYTLRDSNVALAFMRELAQKHIGNRTKLNNFEYLRDRFHLFLFDLEGYEKKSRQATLWYQFLHMFVVLFKEESLANDGPSADSKSGCCSVV